MEHPPPVPFGLQAQALVAVVLAQVLLRLRGTASALRFLARRGPRGGLSPASATRAVRRAGRLTRGACLPQAVALTALLRRAGADPTLVLGCRRYGEGVWGAHAWVDLEGERLEPVVSPDHEVLATCRPEHAWEPQARQPG